MSGGISLSRAAIICSSLRGAENVQVIRYSVQTRYERVHSETNIQRCKKNNKFHYLDKCNGMAFITANISSFMFLTYTPSIFDKTHLLSAATESVLRSKFDIE